jgi:hypothetical protein
MGFVSDPTAVSKTTVFGTFQKGSRDLGAHTHLPQVLQAPLSMHPLQQTVPLCHPARHLEPAPHPPPGGGARQERLSKLLLSLLVELRPLPCAEVGVVAVAKTLNPSLFVAGSYFAHPAGTVAGDLGDDGVAYGGVAALGLKRCPCLLLPAAHPSFGHDVLLLPTRFLFRRSCVSTASMMPP